jgi:hypothetical protein
MPRKTKDILRYTEKQIQDLKEIMRNEIKARDDEIKRLTDIIKQQEKATNLKLEEMKLKINDIVSDEISTVKKIYEHKLDSEKKIYEERIDRISLDYKKIRENNNMKIDELKLKLIDYEKIISELRQELDTSMKSDSPEETLLQEECIVTKDRNNIIKTALSNFISKYFIISKGHLIECKKFHDMFNDHIQDLNIKKLSRYEIPQIKILMLELGHKITKRNNRCYSSLLLKD